MFWALLKAHFNPYLTARDKMSLSLAHNIIIYARQHELYCFDNGSEKIIYKAGVLTVSSSTEWEDTVPLFAQMKG